VPFAGISATTNCRAGSLYNVTGNSSRFLNSIHVFPVGLSAGSLLSDEFWQAVKKNKQSKNNAEICRR